MTSGAALQAAEVQAGRILNSIVLPAGAHRVSHLDGPQFTGGYDAPICQPQADGVRYWTVPGNATDVVAFVQERPAAGLTGAGDGPLPSDVPAGEVVTETNGVFAGSLLDITVAQINTETVGVRADAYVAPTGSECPSAGASS